MNDRTDPWPSGTSRAPILLGVDTGGTFTDFVCIEDGSVRTDKVLSTPDDPARAVLSGIERLGLVEAMQAGRLRIVHGSTVATNAALEQKGVPTAYVTNRGFEDVLHIGRQARDTLYTLTPDRAPIPLAPEACIGTGGRLTADGSELEPLTENDIREVVAAVRALGPQAVAINLLYSWLDDSAERRLEAALAPLALVSRSSHVLPEYREYERGIATWLNAWLGPLVRDYLLRLDAATAPSPLAVMQSTGGTIAADRAADRAVHLLVSGPAGGLQGARHQAMRAGHPAVLTFDMGGTSTDVALVDGPVRMTTESRVGPFPVAVPMAEIHTIGSGGGSIAWIDEGGMLRVGPRSAGASPGPACYGAGGTDATVTDANVVLGRLPAGFALGGELRLDVDAAHTAIARLADRAGLEPLDLAAGIVRVANEQMEQALRVISVARGLDPRAYALMCFGGAGGLHVCALAEGLGIRTVLVPALAGVLSAFGMLTAQPERHLSRSLLAPLDDVAIEAVHEAFDALERAGTQELVAEGHAADTLTHVPSVDLRYAGQSFPLELEWQDDVARLADAFSQLHARRYGHRLALPVELVNVRLASRAPARAVQSPPWQRTSVPRDRRATVHGVGSVTVRLREELDAGERLEGPLLIAERTTTTWVAPGWTGHVDADGLVTLVRRARPAPPRGG